MEKEITKGRKYINTLLEPKQRIFHKNLFKKQQDIKESKERMKRIQQLINEKKKQQREQDYAMKEKLKQILSSSSSSKQQPEDQQQQ
jgi:hypothetical protein